MKVLIKAACIDKYSGAPYSAGNVIEVSEERGAEMLSASEYVELVADDTKPKKKKKA